MAPTVPEAARRLNDLRSKGTQLATRASDEKGPLRGSSQEA
jgi:hypothetical protein